MPLIAYKPKTFRPDAQDVIFKANAILDEYAGQGFDLTLRQLYYQFVARGLLPNNDRSYKRLGSIVNDARLAGFIDWSRITDRTRFVREQTFWSSPAQIIRATASSFQLDKWATQENYVEVWVEKDALVGVIERACHRLEAAYLSCRGYVSQSEMWAASQRLGDRIANGQRVTILHLGDHDPSGIDMSRDIEQRIRDFLWGDGRDDMAFDLRRIALNADQVEQYDPPPNPAKLTDARARSYIDRFGYESWELDALEPTVISDLITEHVMDLRDEEAWAKIDAEEQQQLKVLVACHQRWDEVARFLNGGES